MAKPGGPSAGLDDSLYLRERLANRDASGLSIDESCADEGVSDWCVFFQPLLAGAHERPIGASPFGLRIGATARTRAVLKYLGAYTRFRRVRK